MFFLLFLPVARSSDLIIVVQLFTAQTVVRVGWVSYILDDPFQQLVK